jgi:hypothetical protein
MKFTCRVTKRYEPLKAKATYVMQKNVLTFEDALKEALCYHQLSGGFCFFEDFRCDGVTVDVSGKVLLKTGEIVNGRLDNYGKLIKE